MSGASTAGVEQPPLDLGDGRGRLGQVHGDAHASRTRRGRARGTGGRVAVDVGRVGVRHRLDDDRGPAADLDPADANPDGPVTRHEFDHSRTAPFLQSQLFVDPYVTAARPFRTYGFRTFPASDTNSTGGSMHIVTVTGRLGAVVVALLLALPASVPAQSTCPLRTSSGCRTTSTTRAPTSPGCAPAMPPRRTGSRPTWTPCAKRSSTSR